MHFRFRNFAYDIKRQYVFANISILNRTLYTLIALPTCVKYQSILFSKNTEYA